MSDPDATQRKILDLWETGGEDAIGEAVRLTRDAMASKGTNRLPAWLFQFRAWADAHDAELLLDGASRRSEPWSAEECEQAWETALRLKEASLFSPARRLLANLAGEPDDLVAGRTADLGRRWPSRRERRAKAVRTLAVCTYKDPDVQLERSLPEAERLLGTIGLHDAGCTDVEVLGVGGAVCKRFWEVSGRYRYLVASHAAYLRGWNAADPSSGARLDGDAYCGINAAFVLDLMAECHEAGDPSRTQRQRDEATALRTRIRETLGPTPNSGWAWASLAEACFGTGDFAAAREAYARTTESLAGDWERQTMFLQAVRLAQARQFDLASGPAGDEPAPGSALWAIWPILGARTAAAVSGAGGKVGLALSGGGFRAAFYHLGVLARLAEIDALRRVEVLSTVSGGSIVGAHCFLKLKRLLESRGDAVDRTDYVRLVEEMIDEFHAGVATNLRMRAFGSLKTIGRMFVSWAYNRTLRMGEL